MSTNPELATQLADVLRDNLQREYGCKPGMVHEGYGTECASAAHAPALFRTFGCDHVDHVATVLAGRVAAWISSDPNGPLAQIAALADKWDDDTDGRHIHWGAVPQIRAALSSATTADRRARWCTTFWRRGVWMDEPCSDCASESPEESAAIVDQNLRSMGSQGLTLPPEQLAAQTTGEATA